MPHPLIQWRAACASATLLFSLNNYGGETKPDAASADLTRQIEAAVAAESSTDYRKARELYTQATKAHPAAAEAWAALGEHLRFYAHDNEAAGTAFRNALAAQEKNARASAFAWRGLGELEAKAGREAAALEHFKKSVEAQPLADTYRSICHLYCKQRKFKQAADAAGEAVKLNPEDGIARLLYAAQLHRAGEKEKGRKEFEAAISGSGLSADGEAAGHVHCCILYNAAGYLSVCGESEKALKMLRKFFETPNHRHLTRADVESDADFENLKTISAFSRLLDLYYKENAAPKTAPEPAK